MPSAIASDVRPGPLSRAEEHVRENGLQDKIETRLSDGLKAIHPGEGDTLVIAGMGGPLMERILSDSREVRDTFKELILQPQSDIPHFRKYLLDEGLRIIDERIVEEEGKFYPMMKAKNLSSNGLYASEEHSRVEDNSHVDSAWRPAEIQYGRYLLKSHDPVMERYLAREKKILENILLQLESEAGGRALQRKQEVEEQLKLLEEAIENR